MKTLFKNHFIYFVKNKPIIFLLLIFGLMSFSVVPFFIIDNLKNNFNWIIYFILFVLSLFSIFIMIYYFFISTKKNQYDTFLSSMYSSGLKILISKYLFLLTIFSIFSFLISIVPTSFMFINYKNNMFGFIYFILLMLSTFFMMNILFWLFMFFMSFKKNIIYKNIALSLTAIVVLSTPILIKSFVSKSNYQNKFKNVYKIVEKTKNNSFNVQYVPGDNYIKTQEDTKFYIDLVDSFYFLPIYIANLFENKNLNINFRISSNLENDERFALYRTENKLIQKKWNKDSNFYIYGINDEPLISYSNDQLNKLINDNLYSKIENKNNIKIVSKIIEKLYWERSKIPIEQQRIIELISGVKNKKIQYLRRDWKALKYNNSQLINVIKQNFGLNFLELLNNFYDTYEFNSISNVDAKNGQFYFKKSIEINDTYNLENKISEIDEKYIKNNFLQITDEKVFFNLNSSKVFSISLLEFRKVFSNITSQDKWISFIDENKFQLFKIQNILDKIYLFSDENNSVLKYTFQPNASIGEYYNNVIQYKSILGKNTNIINVFLIIIITLFLIPTSIIWSKKGRV
ncbi:hypothetical protein DMC14_002840 [Metamycoplasma phocicerebrale]|uniref:Uncharacterized protein n=1 Tax=Metamycoplasma phocicerebrale TaxID=142649 RepID=A0A3Q9V5P8_9BACT|nr:hypothetical protein [Metamycoplasma phocicerebrale]AZZ65703.1 hypothetical protein DMC14_002840 [Metamycoplasma phocicerebrale]